MPECYVDTNLMNVLLGRMCNHQKGCATVFKTLDEKLSNQFAIAVIDQDKRKPEATKQYVGIGKNDHLIVCKHQERPHYLIMINPAIEMFVLDAANELNVKLSDYGLPEDLDKLRDQTKTISAKADKRFESLFKSIRKASNIKCLEELLQYLLDKKYSATNVEICKILRECKPCIS